MRYVVLFAGLVFAACGAEQGGGTDLEGGGGWDTSGGGGSFDPLYNAYLYRCAFCHAPGGPGRTSDTEATLDFTTVDTAYSTIRWGSASGLQGNQEACNGVPFLGPTYEQSLLAAVLDEEVRAAFMAPGRPECNGQEGVVSDMTLKVGSAPSSTFLQSLREWVHAGAPR